LDRLDLQHHLFLITLDGNLQRSPLPKDVHHVLDVGTGTGIWAIDFADKYPSAHVIGTDLSPVQPQYVPPNCRFYVEDAEEDWRFEEPFDFIHTRMLVIGLRDWKRFFHQAFAALKPGGYIELQDLTFPARCDDGTAPDDSPVMVWSRHMMEACRRTGKDLTISTSFPALLNEAGFVDVRAEGHTWPINKWPKEKQLKKLGSWAHQNFMQGLQGFSMGFLCGVLQWEQKDVVELCNKVGEQAKDLNSHVYLPISICWARKPE
jgi:SAM-dependent methyltransferase